MQKYETSADTTKFTGVCDFLEEGIEISRSHDDYAFTGLLKAIKGHIGGEPLVADVKKSLKAMLERKDNYDEREAYLDCLIGVLHNSPYCQETVPDRSIVLIEIAVDLFRGGEKAGKKMTPGIFTRRILTAEV